MLDILPVLAKLCQLAPLGFTKGHESKEPDDVPRTRIFAIIGEPLKRRVIPLIMCVGATTVSHQNEETNLRIATMLMQPKTLNHQN